MSQAEEFISLYNEMDDFLRRQLSEKGRSADQSLPFSAAVTQVAGFNPVIRAHEYDLKAMADLRNAIVHRYRGHVIAEPTSQLVVDIQRLVDKVLNPQRADNISTKNLRIFDGEENLSEVLNYMKERQYSQIVVWQSERAHLLSTVGITRWLEDQGPELILELKDVTLLTVLEHEPFGSFKLVERTKPADEIREMFLTPPAKATERLQAVVVTNSGKKHESPIGIITPWDIVF